MSIEKKITSRFIENIHVGLWLVKDTSWMMEYKFLGCIMIIPTIVAAVWILNRSRESIEFWVNLAVLFWIMANSSWMIIEFFHFSNKIFVLPLFIAGFISFIIYLYQYYRAQSND